MAAHKSIWTLISLAGLGIAGCRGTPPPTAPPQAPAAQKAPATPPQAATPAPPPQEKPKSSSAVVVDPGMEGDGTPESLVEAARAEKERKARAGKPMAVINDKNLPKYASKGQITIADPKEKEKKGGAKGAKPAQTSVPTGEVRDEQYWRNRARDIRERWHQADEDVKKLEQKSTELRQKFYLENDLFVRDNQIKPEWDRVLDRLRQARLDEEAIKTELDTFLEEGRAAGAMPGWLNEGEEEEPKQDSAKGTSRKKELPPAQSIEPPVLNDGGHGRGQSRDDGHGGLR